MKAFLSVTAKCNMRCEYCYYNTGYLRADNNADPSLEELKKRIDFCKEFGCDKISFTGGEPFTRANQLFELIDYADNLGIKSVVVTNGKYFWKDVNSSLPERTINKVTCMAISLHIDRNTHIDEYFDKLRYATKERLAFFQNRIRFNFTLTKHNSNYLDKCIFFSKDMGIDLNIQPVVIDSTNPLAVYYDIRNIEENKKPMLYDQIGEWAQKSNNVDYGKRLIKYIREGNVESKECGAGKSFIIIQEGGEILPCFYRNDLSYGKYSDHSPAKYKEYFEKFNSQQKSCGGEQCIVLMETGGY